MGDPICRLDEVPDGEARGFGLEDDEGRGFRVIVLRRGDSALVYRNQCPHRGTPLDWSEDRFFDASGEHLICATHGALFRPDDGVCIAGPCAGDALPAVEVKVQDGVVWQVG